MTLIDQNIDPDVCIYYERTGCCPRGDLCKRKHILTALPRCVVLHHIFPNPDFFINSLPPGTLQIQNDEKQRLIDAFFVDICLMMRNFGLVDDVAIASNTSDCLSGNVWVWFRESDSAIMCKNALNGQYYAGRKILVTLCSSPRFSISVCKNAILGSCSAGLGCYFIHTLEPSYHIFNECIPRSMKVYPEQFRKWKTPVIFDSPNDIIAGKCKATIGKNVNVPKGFPTRNIYLQN